NADGFVVSFNMYQGDLLVNPTFDHTSVLAVSNNAAPANIRVVPGGTTRFTLAPASMHNATVGGPMWFVDHPPGPDPSPQNSPGTTVEVLGMTNPFTATPSFAGSLVTVNPYSTTVAPHQPGGQMTANGLNDPNLGTQMYFSALRTIGGVT